LTGTFGCRPATETLGPFQSHPPKHCCRTVVATQPKYAANCKEHTQHKKPCSSDLAFGPKLPPNTCVFHSTAVQHTAGRTPAGDLPPSTSQVCSPQTLQSLQASAQTPNKTRTRTVSWRCLGNSAAAAPQGQPQNDLNDISGKEHKQTWQSLCLAWPMQAPVSLAGCLPDRLRDERKPNCSEVDHNPRCL
jgi:hypothetical protein